MHGGLLSNALVEGEQHIVDPCVQGEQCRKHVESINQTHVKDEQQTIVKVKPDTQGNAYINDAINDSFFVVEGFYNVE